MTLQTILNRLQKLHPKEIDLSLDRVKNLCKKLGNPQKDLKYISVVGTNGKYSTIQALRAILKEANIKCNIYTSPHIQRINERFIFNDEEISDSDLSDLLVNVEEVNNGEEITYFEILTAAYFFHASKYKENINIIESGLFHRFDATNIIDKNILSIVTAIGLDHLDWLPKNEQTIKKIIYEKTSTLLNSKIGDLLGPLDTNRGWALIKVKGIAPIDSTDYEGQKDVLKTNLFNREQNQVFQFWLEDLKTRAEIVDNRKYIF